MRILFVDDEPLGRDALSVHIESQLGHHVTCCGGAVQALEAFRNEAYQMVLSDIRMPGMDGIELLKRLKELPQGRAADVVLVTAHGDMSTAVSALRAGAYDYLNKPIDLDELTAVIERVTEHQALIKENYELTHHFSEKVREATRETQSRLEQLQSAYAGVVGLEGVGVFSDTMRQVVDTARKLHRERSISVLIEGETGTGKEIIARLIHYGDGGVSSPLVPINCPAISPSLFESELFGYEGGAFTGARREGQKGKFELAQGGSLFFDEIGDMPLDLQPKLLRVLQERNLFRVGGLKKIEIDVRVICATNRDLERQVKSGRFRQDLFYRLNVGRLYLPPLRERREEIGPLAQMYLEQLARQKKLRFRSINPQALAILEDHGWPGNVRELKNTIERVVLLHDDEEIKPGHLDFLLSGKPVPALRGAAARVAEHALSILLPPEGLRLDDVEAQVIRKALDLHQGNITRTAAFLGLTRCSLRRKIERLLPESSR